MSPARPPFPDNEIRTRRPSLTSPISLRPHSYPAKIREHHHHTLAYLPTDVALALSDSPSLIAEAVGAFYEREPGMLKVRLPSRSRFCSPVFPDKDLPTPISLQAVNTMSRFPPAASSPSTPADSMSDDSTATAAASSSALPNPVLVPVRLTRPLYSQLILQRFYAPKPFLKAGWFEAKKGRDDERRREVGMKIVSSAHWRLTMASSNLQLIVLVFAISSAPVYRPAALKCSTNSRRRECDIPRTMQPALRLSTLPTRGTARTSRP